MSKVKRIKFRRSDYSRAILTDTLPYEVPLLFSNDGYYERIKSGCRSELEKNAKINFFDSEAPTIAYTYRVKKDELSSRALSVMHPSIQIKIAEFYQSYAKIIIGLCNKSSFSLRRPYRVASHYYEKNRASKYITGELGAEAAADGNNAQQKNSSSFFTYKNYVLIHKFYESTEFHELEKKFRLLRTLDISKCFPHIYTHSISWAVRSKNFAKENRTASETFDAKFDKIMRHSNHEETNGIIVGPETSRIFAEIILQSIDNDIQEELYKAGLTHDQDYSIRRYVDDYFIFSNSSIILDNIQKVIATHLERYKLYLNEAKTETTSRPFISGQTSAKIEIAAIVDELFSNHVYSRKELKDKAKEKLEETAASLVSASPSETESETESEEESDGLAKNFPIRYVGNYSKLSATYIRRIKSAIAANESSFDHISNYFFSVLRKRTIDLLERIDVTEATDAQIDRFVRFIKCILEIMFFLLSMSPKVRTTYQICQICLALSKFAQLLPNEPQENLLGSIAIHLRTSISNFAHRDSDDNVETLNLLTLLNTFGHKYSLSQQEVADFFGIAIDRKKKHMILTKDFRYFQIVSLLHYVHDSNNYVELRDLVQKYVSEHLSSLSAKAIAASSDLTMLLFDYLRCPYVAQSHKVTLSKSILRKVSDKDINARCERFLEVVNQGDWFFAWKAKDLLGAVLWKKELRPAY